jgi:hypothetical protein
MQDFLCICDHSLTSRMLRCVVRIRRCPCLPTWTAWNFDIDFIMAWKKMWSLCLLCWPIGAIDAFSIRAILRIVKLPNCCIYELNRYSLEISSIHITSLIFHLMLNHSVVTFCIWGCKISHRPRSNPESTLMKGSSPCDSIDNESGPLHCTVVCWFFERTLFSLNLLLLLCIMHNSLLSDFMIY